MKYSSLVLALSVMTFFSACNNSDNSSKTIVEQDSVVENAGVKISYEDTKKGDTTLLFVHGWAINKTYWKDQVAHFRDHYRVVTVDLPGFGESGKNRTQWTVEEYGNDLKALMSKLDLKNVILVGHSMSGAIVVETALKNPDRVIAVVGVDNFTNVGAEMSDELKKEIASAYAMMRTNYTQTVSQYANQSMFSPSTDSSVRRKVLTDFTGVDSVLAVNILEKNDAYPLDAKLQSLGKTLYLINSNWHPTDTAGFKKLNIPFKLFYVGPTGHYPMIENAAEFNRQLKAVINEISSSKK